MFTVIGVESAGKATVRPNLASWDIVDIVIKHMKGTGIFREFLIIKTHGETTSDNTILYKDSPEGIREYTVNITAQKLPC